MNGQKRYVAALILLILPPAFVFWAKQTDWAAAMVVPHARQKGDPGAPVIILEYSDFQCPACAHIQPVLKGLMEAYKGKALLMFKYFPLRMHKNALPAAQAAECAGDQNQFWPYGDRLFETQSQWAPLTDTTTSFMAIAVEVKLNVPAFTACLADPAKRDLIMKDVEEGERRQINSTPTFFVGDQRLVGPVFATDGARAIEKELRK
jgi:protein-disulfide isomerase